MPATYQVLATIKQSPQDRSSADWSNSSRLRNSRSFRVTPSFQMMVARTWSLMRGLSWHYEASKAQQAFSGGGEKKKRKRQAKELRKPGSESGENKEEN